MVPRFPSRIFLSLLLASTTFLPTFRSSSAGVTIITHGLNGNIDDWVLSMAEKIPNYYRFPGSSYSCYELYFTLINNSYVLTWRRLAGSPPGDTASAEIVVKLDWRQLANDSYNTYEIASAVVPALLNTNFISEWPGHALAELPIHLVGHSRGGSLVCEISRLLGTNGVWVDHLTTLDPHPLNNDGFFDFPYLEVDAPARTYENVLFHDNYYQTLNLLFYGESVAGAYSRELTDLDGGYGGLAASHSDVHLWYHGTLDLEIPTDDSVASITSAERQAWWDPYEYYGLFAGFYYSRIAGGDRLSTDQPEGTSRIRDGFNQRWDLGAGVANNRTALSTNRGDWANIIKFELSGTNLLAQGQSSFVTLHYQWARPTNTTATIQLFLDDDLNPANGNEKLLRTVSAPGTAGAGVSHGSLSFTVTTNNSVPGIHSIFSKISTQARVRYLYAPEIITVMSTFQPPRLVVESVNQSGPTIGVAGVAGQRIVIRSSPDLLSWQALATNWLTSPLWEFHDVRLRQAQMFYRGSVE